MQISLITVLSKRRKREKKEKNNYFTGGSQCVEDVGRWFELVRAVRDTKAGIRSAEKFISALLTGRKLNMPYWFSASRAPGETNRALCKQRAHRDLF